MIIKNDPIGSHGFITTSLDEMVNPSIPSDKYI